MERGVQMVPGPDSYTRRVSPGIKPEDVPTRSRFKGGRVSTSSLLGFLLLFQLSCWVVDVWNSFDLIPIFNL